MTDVPAGDGPARAPWLTIAFYALGLFLIFLALAPAVEGSKIILATAGGSPDWLIGIDDFLGWSALAGDNAGWLYYVPLMIAAVLWGIVVWKAEAIGVKQLTYSSMGMIVLFFLAPPLLSQDVFSYIAYARLGVEHGLNPYAFRPFDIPGDPVFPYAGSKDAVNVYGPYFTLLTYPLAWLSVPLSFWLLKFFAATSMAGLVFLVRNLADRLDAVPARAVAIVGLCPAALVHVVAGAHNEALVMLIVFAGIALTFTRIDGSRDALGGFISTLAIGVKASAAVPLVFMLAAARRKVAMFAAMAGAAALTVVTAMIGFGTESLNALNLISSNQDRSSSYSLPHQIVDALGAIFGDIDRAATTDVVRAFLTLILAGVVIYLIRRSWEKPETWLANAGWATLGVLLASAWLVPWYLVWLLPFAALGRCRSLQIATVLFCAYTLAIAIPF